MSWFRFKSQRQADNFNGKCIEEYINEDEATQEEVWQQPEDAFFCGICGNVPTSEFTKHLYSECKSRK